MGGFAEYDRYDAVGLAALVRKREVSGRELLQEALDRCDRINPKLNAVIYRMDARAESAAGAAGCDAPLAGVPFLAKDLGPALAGAPLTCGSRLFAGNVAEEDGELIKRFKRAGLIFFGKTNVPEFGLLPFTEPALFGPCRNPWDLSRTPGGSSGGAAAAVAGGIVPMAHGSDGGGSIRIPASCCGLFGLKPSRGLNPRVVQVHTVTEDFGADHVLSRSVRDSAAALDAVCNRINPSFLAGLESGPGRLKIAVARSAMLGRKVAPEVRAALDRAVRLAQGLGHDVSDAEPAADYAGIRTAFLTFWAVSTRQILDAATNSLGRKPLGSDLEFATWALASIGKIMAPSDIEKARRTFWTATKVFTAFFENYDVFMSPVLAQPPLTIGANAMTKIEKISVRAVQASGSPSLMKALLRAIAAKNFAFAAFTAPFNITGQPAMSVPLYWTPDGLPIGIQFGAKLGADGLLLRLARQLEMAQGWAARRPPVWAGQEVREAA